MISPLLPNVALHGLEQAAGIRYATADSDAATVRHGSPVVIRYADVTVVLCHSQRQAGQVKARLGSTAEETAV